MPYSRMTYGSRAPVLPSLTPATKKENPTLMSLRVAAGDGCGGASTVAACGVSVRGMFCTVSATVSVVVVVMMCGLSCNA